MPDLLTSSLTHQLRELGADKTRILLFTGSSLRSGRLVPSARILTRLLGGRVVGVIDDAAGVGRLRALPGWESAPDIPVLSSVEQLRTIDPAAEAVVVTALDLPTGKRLLGRHVDVLLSLADSGRTVFSSLERSPRHSSVVDLRQCGRPERARFEDREPHSNRVMLYRTTPDTSAVEAAVKLVDGFRGAEIAADWLPSTPLGMTVRGFGRVPERCPIEFAAGLVEELLQIMEPQARVIVVEGGSLLDASAMVATTAQVQGSKPSFHALVHRARHTDDGLLAELDDVLRRAGGLHQGYGIRSTLLGVVLDTSALEERAARRLCAEVQKRGLSCLDIHRTEVTQFVDAVEALGGEVT